MADAYHFMTGDLQFGSNGDLQTVDSVLESQQRILRRLPTNPGDYIWHPLYGGGILKWIGQPTDQASMKSVITTQMYLEQSVVQNPQPQVDLVSNTGGVVTSSIRYVESDSNEPTTLSFQATP
jgi:phage baseplate assembly protein W